MIHRVHKVETRDEYKARAAPQINQFLNLVYVLLFFRYVITLFGIANTLGLSIDRTPSRARFVARGGHDPSPVLRSSVRWESVIIALLSERCSVW